MNFNSFTHLIKTNKGLSIAFVLFLLFAYFPLFYQLDTLSLRLWDEARRGVNALEMAAGESHLLVPTFEGQPDRWGTKPPLLVWMQASFIKLLGPTELAIRLPAALAGLATLLVFIWFGMRVLKTPWIGLLAGMVLLTTDLYIESHGARAGDFDALLVLWETCFVLCFFIYLQSRKNKALYWSGLFLILAGWTKGVAAFFFLPTIALFTIIHPAARFVWQSSRVYLTFSVCLLSVLSYYLFREMLDPGFVTGVWNNELGGRYLASQEGHQWEWYFYFRMLWKYPLFQPWLFLLPFAIIHIWQHPRFRVFTQYLLTLSFGLLAVLSISATKLIWYILPIIPLLSLIIGMGLWVIYQKLSFSLSARGIKMNWGIIALLFIGVFSWPYYTIIQKVAAQEHNASYHQLTPYRDFIKETKTEGAITLLVPSFNPHAAFYQQKANREGRDISLEYINPPELKVDATPNILSTYAVGTKVAVCEMAPWEQMAKHYLFKELVVYSPCKLLEVTAIK